MSHTKKNFVGTGLTLAALAALPVAAQIARPQLGTVMDAGGALRPVIGVAAAASLGDSALDNVVSFACSARLCLAKTDAALIPFAPANATSAQTSSGSSTPGGDGTPAPPGPALIAMDDRAAGGDPTQIRAWIYFTESQQAALWQNGALTMIDFAPEGGVLALRAASDGFDYAIARNASNVRRRAGNPWIEHYSASDGSITIIGSVVAGAPIADPFAVTAVMLIHGGVLAATSSELILTHPDGSQMTFPLAGARAFFQAGKGTVEIVAAEGLWILRTDPGSEQLALLPGAPQGVGLAGGSAGSGEAAQ